MERAVAIVERVVATTRGVPGATEDKGSEEGEGERMEVAPQTSHRDNPPPLEKTSSWNRRWKTSTTTLLKYYLTDLEIPTITVTILTKL